MDNTHKVFTRDYKGKPVISHDFNKCKTFKNINSLDRTIKNILEPNGYTYTIYQVKDLFEPRYFVRLKDPGLLINITPPILTCYRSWYLKNNEFSDTYVDREKAQEVLDKYKLTLLQFYHNKIIELKDFRLD